MDIYTQHMVANPGLDPAVYTRAYWDDLIATSWDGIDYRVPMVAPALGRTYRTRNGLTVGPMVAKDHQDYAFNCDGYLGWTADGRYDVDGYNPHDLIEVVG